MPELTHNHRGLRRAGAILLGLALASCGPYRFANDLTHSESHVNVVSIAAPAELGLNTPALRALLSAQLFDRGLASAPDADYTLRCAIGAHRSTGFDQALVAEVDLSCPLSYRGTDLEWVEATGVHTDALDPALSSSTAALQSTDRARELAAADALSQIATRVAYLIDRHHRRETAHE
ncbi:hypothetical protein [Lujinxingia litoralis]|nr:hypothetical protein [Lujinxingia litoralis]